LLSNNYETPFEDGVWVSKLEAAIAFNVTERTIENRIRSDALKSRIGPDGKVEIYLRNGHRISKGLENDTVLSKEIRQDDHWDSKSAEQTSKEIDEIKFQLENLNKELVAVKLAHAQLLGESSGKDKLLQEKDRLIQSKDEVIQAKDQAINAANAAVMLLEQRNQTLEADPKRLQGSQVPQAEEKKGWFDKILGR
jgi:hypothetical protein